MALADQIRYIRNRLPWELLSHLKSSGNVIALSGDVEGQHISPDYCLFSATFYEGPLV